MLAHQRSVAIRGPQVHDRTIVTDRPDRMWAIDATGGLADEGMATAFVLLDHCTGEFPGVRAALRSSRYEALECLREAVWANRRRCEVGIAVGVSRRQDPGSQFISHAFRAKLRTLGYRVKPVLRPPPRGQRVR